MKLLLKLLEDMKCTICNGKKDTIEHALECQRAETGVIQYKRQYL